MSFLEKDSKSKRPSRALVSKSKLATSAFVKTVSPVYGRMSVLLGERITSEFDILRVVKLGLPSSAFGHLVKKYAVDLRLIGPETTVRRRMQEKKPFTTEESERLVRFARITSMAEELFGQTQATNTWLSTRSDYLPDSDPISPIELCATDSGARVVESLLLQTAHGIF